MIPVGAPCVQESVSKSSMLQQENEAPACAPIHANSSVRMLSKLRQYA